MCQQSQVTSKQLIPVKVCARKWGTYWPIFVIVPWVVIRVSLLHLSIVAMYQRRRSIFFLNQVTDILNVKISSNINDGYHLKRERYIDLRCGIVESYSEFKVVLYSKKVMLGCKSHFFLNGKIVIFKHLGMLSWNNLTRFPALKQRDLRNLISSMRLFP